MLALTQGMMSLRPGSAVEGSAVEFVAATGANYTANGTSISSPSTPAGVLAGDGLFAILYGRSTLTPPSGWTLVVSQENPGNITQTLYVYRKNTTDPGDSSTAFTWTQAVSGRMGLSYCLVRSSSGTITAAESAGARADFASALTHSIPVPVLTASVNGELFIIAGTSLVADQSPNNSTWTAPSGATMRTTPAAPENRLGFATQSRDAGQSNSTPFVFSMTNAAANEPASIVLRLTS